VTISKSEFKRFEKMWHTSQNKVRGLDGQMKEFRGLGYKSKNDTPRGSCFTQQYIVIRATPHLIYSLNCIGSSSLPTGCWIKSLFFINYL